MPDATLSTVHNAAQLLKEFTRDAELGVSELARRLGLGKSKVHRLLATLRSDGLVEQDPRSGRYRLGLVLLELGDAARVRTELHTAAAPVLMRLREQTGEAVEIAVPDRDDIVFLERLSAAHTLRIGPPLEAGRRWPLYCTAAGKVLLAHRPERAREAYLAGTTLTPVTRQTVVNPDRLREEITATLARGWAEAVNELEAGISALAAPIRGATAAVVAAVGVRAPTIRYRGASRRRLALAVVQAGEAISRRLGWAHRDHGA